LSGEGRVVLELHVSPSTLEDWGRLSTKERELLTRLFEAAVAYATLRKMRASILPGLIPGLK